jgi:hypothetical protein
MCTEEEPGKGVNERRVDQVQEAIGTVPDKRGSPGSQTVSTSSKLRHDRRTKV